jgi:DNA-binding response OmpR family regulator
MKILIVEDERALREEIETVLDAQGFVHESASTFADAHERMGMYAYDVVILDLTLPGGSGLDLLKMLKREHPDTGVLIISARDSLDDKLAGLGLGADDYLTKPFHLAELNARVHALNRRRLFRGSETITVENLVIDTDAKTVAVDGTVADLTRKEYNLLLYFAVNRNRVLSKQSIAEHLWGDDYDMAENYDFVYVHMNNLRRKLLDLGARDLIRTVYGMGYKLVAE